MRIKKNKILIVYKLSIKIATLHTLGRLKEN